MMFDDTSPQDLFRVTVVTIKTVYNYVE